jgi:hypothetical protein
MCQCVQEHAANVCRAWSVVGLALRFAYSLGLHVRNEDSSASPEQREILVRIWWSLYSLERTLGIVTGRPGITVNTFCSVPLPAPISEDQGLAENESLYCTAEENTAPYLSQGAEFQNSTVKLAQLPEGTRPKEPSPGSYFKSVTTLSIIVQDILSSLYSVATMIRPSEELQLQVAHLEQRLNKWACLLPRQFNFQARDVHLDTKFVHERTILRFQLCSAKMLLTRPYLSGRKQQHRENEEASFSNRMGNICIEAAKTVVDFFPETLDSRVIYHQGPWWCIVHYMMQAVAVFLLGLSNPSSTSHRETTLVHYVRRAIQQLQFMQDPIALRAGRIALESFDTVMRNSSLDISNMRADGNMADVRVPEPQTIPSGSGMPAYLNRTNSTTHC